MGDVGPSELLSKQHLFNMLLAFSENRGFKMFTLCCNVEITHSYSEALVGGAAVYRDRWRNCCSCGDSSELPHYLLLMSRSVDLCANPHTDGLE